MNEVYIADTTQIHENQGTDNSGSRIMLLLVTEALLDLQSATCTATITVYAKSLLLGKERKGTRPDNNF